MSVVIIILMMLIALPRFSSGITTFESPISEPSKLQTLDTTAQIESMLLKIDEKLVEKYIQKLQDYKTRYAYRGDKCFQAAEYIHSHFLQNGLEASYSDFTYGGYKMRNIVGQITGTSSPEDIYIICAHYDSTSPLTWTHAPGADDNGSGVAGVMAATEILSDYDFNCTIRFIAFGGEELGLKGSSNYVNQVYSLGEKICGVINLDMIAYNPNPGTNEVYLVRDYGDKLAVKKEYVYGPAPAGDTTVQFWLNHTNIIDCTLCIQEQGLPGTYRKMTEGSPGDYTLNRSTGFIDLSTGWGPLAEYENLTAWYNYSASGFLINYTKMVIQKYAHIIDISPVDYQLGSSDHASFAPIYPALMLIEKKYTSNPNYHKITDTLDHLNLTYCANITQAATATLAELAQLDSVDRASPSHGPGFPPNGCYEQSSPCISIEIRDPSPINLTSLQMRVNGTDILPALTGIPLGYNVSYTPPTPYADGVLVNVSIFAEDIHGNGFNHTWEFTVDAIPPQPPTNFSIASSRIELIKRGLVMNIGTTFDSRQARAPSVLFHEGIYKMWYAGQNSSNFHVCYATSPDGISWTKHGIVLYHGIVGELDSNYASYPTVIFDGEYKMWYSGWNGVNVRIMHANSSDGINWIKHGIAVDVGAAGTMDETYAYFPCVIKTNEYKIWYSGFDGLKHRILYANSTDGITWTKHPEDITPLGPGIMHGDGLVWSPEVTYFDGLYHMYYGRYDGSRYRIMHATSPDGLKWSDKGLAIDVGISGNYDFTGADMCSVLVTENETKVWYSGFNGVNWRIMYANITPQDPAKDLTLTWTASTSPDVVRYEVFRESRPSAFKYPLERSFPEFYVPPTGLTPWTFEAESVANVTAYGPKTGSDPSSFYLPDDNILNIDLYLKSDTGDWLELS
ncbi:MAG: M20/M25/M40 family metallo-hydrolase, partial [Thermoplasmata archaeon]|nr:M20/M25/M40 family metallo-hydrolase [Thermoplasmata archaeon]